MKTNKPEVIAWEVRTLSDPKEQFGTSPSYPEWAEGDADLSITPLISLRDYEVLQTKNDMLRRKLEASYRREERLEGIVRDLERKKFRRFGEEDCWMWGGDGYDHLESLVCPVVIAPSDLLDIINGVDAKKAEIMKKHETSAQQLKDHLTDIQ